MGSITTALMSVPRAQRAQRGLILTFFVHGIISLAYIPRIPELISQINVNFTQWGLILGFAALGGMLPLFFANRLVMRFGTRPIMRFGFSTAALSLAAYGFTHSGWAFGIATFAFALFNSLFNNSLQAQSVMYQDRVGRVVLGKMHASWSIGAFCSSLVSGLLAKYIPLNIFLLAIGLVTMVSFLIISNLLLKPAEDGHTDEKKVSKNIPFFKSPARLWLLAAGLFCAVIPEGSMMDWSAVFAKRELFQGIATVGIPYTAFSLCMIVGRLSVSRFTRRMNIATLGKWAALFGATFMALGAFIGPALATQDRTAGIVVTAVLWGLAGLGAGPMVPTFFSSAGSIKGMPTSQTMARMALITSTTMLVAKIIMGAIAQGISVQIAYVFPIVGFFTAAILAAAVVNGSSPVSPETVLTDAYPATSPVGVIRD